MIAAAPQATVVQLGSWFSPAGGAMKTLVAKSLCNVIHGVSTGHSSPGTLRYIQKNIEYGTCEYIAIYKAISVLRKV